MVLEVLRSLVCLVARNPGIVTIKLICDGLEISLYDFFDSDVFKRFDLEDIG